MKYASQIAWPARSVEERKKDRSVDEQGYYYSRHRDPARDRLVALLGAMQGATGGFAVSSGMAALNLVLNTLILNRSQQDFRPLVIYGAGVYYECAKRITELGQRYGFDCVSLETYDPLALQLKLQEISNPERIALMWIEAIENPRLRVSNISRTNEALKSIAPQSKLIVDNTALPCFQHSLRWGADIEVISLCKYPGQGVVNGGLVLTRSTELERLLYDENSRLGGILGSQDALEIVDRLSGICGRVKKHCQSAETLANLLKNHPAIAAVFYPTLSGEHYRDDQDIIECQMSGMGGGLVSFELAKGLDAGKHLMNLVAALQETLFIQSTFGMSTTHLEHYATFIPVSEVITPGLCRLSVGLKPPDKIWNTLEKLLNQL
jgi:cystathionine beta-lyase/cystathionine gamma-synthase